MVKGKREYSVAAGRLHGAAVRKRGRPSKLLREEDDDDDEMYAYAEEEEESDKIGNVDEGMYAESYVPTTDLKNRVVVAAAAAAAATGAKKKKKKKKRRAVNIAKKKLELVVKEGDDVEDKAHVMKTVELKQMGSSRRKSKPHRAAEVGVECL